MIDLTLSHERSAATARDKKHQHREPANRTRPPAQGCADSTAMVDQIRLGAPLARQKDEVCTVHSHHRQRSQIGVAGADEVQSDHRTGAIMWK